MSQLEFAAPSTTDLPAPDPITREEYDAAFLRIAKKFALQKMDRDAKWRMLQAGLIEGSTINIYAVVKRGEEDESTEASRAGWQVGYYGARPSPWPQRLMHRRFMCRVRVKSIKEFA